MSNRRKNYGPLQPNRLTTPPVIKPLPAGKQLAPYHVPALAPGKFRDIPGELTLEDMGCIEVPDDAA
jgi:hypothetical protein